MIGARQTLKLTNGFAFASSGVSGTKFKVRLDKPAVVTDPEVFTRTLDNRQYELVDHLGNVRNVITDETHRPLQHLLDYEESLLTGQGNKPTE